jgi:hypothetical protein
MTARHHDSAMLPTEQLVSGSPVLRSQKRTVESPDPLASRRPSGLKLTVSTASEWPVAQPRDWVCQTRLSDATGVCLSTGKPRAMQAQPRECHARRSFATLHGRLTDGTASERPGPTDRQHRLRATWPDYLI